MISDPLIISTMALIAALFSLVGGGLGLFVFFYFRRKRAFIEYLNNRLSKGSDNARNR
jgi:hypothetical protein